MKNSCKYIKLGDICEKITKGTTPSTYGYPFISSGVNYIKAESITKEGRINPSSFVYISEEAHQKLKRSQIKLNDVLFTMAGIFLGKVAILKDKSMLPANTNQAVAIIRISYRCANPFYVYYFLQQDSITRYVNSSTGQSAQPNINLNEISNLGIRLPSIDIQNCIVNILRSLDDKIELNNKINRNLEAQAQAIFKSWFIDFEPFKNGKFIDSELGKIPEGWKVVLLSNIANFEKGKKPKTTFENGNDGVIPYLTIEALSGGNVTYCETEKMVLAKENEILLVMDGASSGTLFYGMEGAVASTIAKLNSSDISLQEIIFEFISYRQEDLKSHNTGSAIPHLDKTYLLSYKMVIPSDKTLLLKVSFWLKTLRAKIIQNKKESQRLAQLRDTLLPKLMSGEIDVSDVAV